MILSKCSNSVLHILFRKARKEATTFTKTALEFVKIFFSSKKKKKSCFFENNNHYNLLENLTKNKNTIEMSVEER